MLSVENTDVYFTEPIGLEQQEKISMHTDAHVQGCLAAPDS